MFYNISERYGDRVEVVVKDYEELNPQHSFEIVGDEIHEFDEDGDFVEVVARDEAN